MEPTSIPGHITETSHLQKKARAASYSVSSSTTEALKANGERDNLQTNSNKNTAIALHKIAQKPHTHPTNTDSTDPEIGNTQKSATPTFIEEKFPTLAKDKTKILLPMQETL